MMLRLMSGLGFAVSLFVATPTLAATTTYTDAAIFNATLSASVVDDYSNPAYLVINSNAAMSAVLGETDYTSTAFPDWNLVVVGGYCAGCNGSFTLGFTTTSVGTASGVFGVGFNFANYGLPGYTAFVTYGDGSSENISVPSESLSSPLVSYFGLTSDLLITSIAFGLPNGGTTFDGGFVIDNLTIGAGISAVPLPAGGVLLVTGLAGFGWLRRRRGQTA